MWAHRAAVVLVRIDQRPERGCALQPRVNANANLVEHVGFGNHDYAVPQVSREMSHELFRRKLGVKPYYAIDHRGWKFIHLNNFLGATWQVGHAKYRKQQGSLGEEQLTWLEAPLAEQRPTMIFIHYPLSVVEPTEVRDLGLHTLLRRHASTGQRVISGHWHR